MRPKMCALLAESSWVCERRSSAARTDSISARFFAKPFWVAWSLSSSSAIAFSIWGAARVTDSRRVDSEARVFDLASDRVALETRLLELKAKEFEREAAYLAALKDVVAGIVPGTTGFLGVAPVLQQQLNLGGVQIVLGQGVTPAQAQIAGEQVIEGMLRSLVRERSRFGLPV